MTTTNRCRRLAQPAQGKLPAGAIPLGAIAYLHYRRREPVVKYSCSILVNTDKPNRSQFNRCSIVRGVEYCGRISAKKARFFGFRLHATGTPDH